jgi:lysozyme
MSGDSAAASRAGLVARLGAVTAAGLIAFVGGKEGLRTVAYLDYGGIPTACFGETRNIRLGMSFTPEQCRGLLVERVLEHVEAVERCVQAPGGRPLPAGALAAFGSFAYNVGAPKFCASTMARLARAGDVAAACREFARWTFVGGRDCRKAENLCNGIVIRRREEQAMCEGGLT